MARYLLRELKRARILTIWGKWGGGGRNALINLTGDGGDGQSTAPSHTNSSNIIYFQNPKYN